jgi:type VI secretion system secreted protein VgrG
MKRAITIKSPLGMDKDGNDLLLFERMVGHEALGTPFEYRVTVLSSKGDLDFNKLLGQTVTIEIDTARETKRYYNGHVTSFAYVGSKGALFRYELVMRPWLWLLSLNANCKVFQNKDAVTIAKEICKDNGFTDVEQHVQNPPPKMEYSIQYRESDFNYVSRLLEHAGIYYFFKHDDGKHTLVLCDNPDAHEAAPKYDAIKYFSDRSEDKTRDDHLSHWTVGRKMRPGAYATTDYDFTNPKSDLTAVRSKPAGEFTHSEYEVFDYPGRYVVSSLGTKEAQVRLEELQGDFEVATGGGNVMGLSVGASFKLEGLAREDQNAEHTVIAASYHWHIDAYGSGANEEFGVEGSYHMIPKLSQYRVPAHTPRPRVEGPQTALVVGPQGDEVHTDKHGRIKVQFYWDRLGAQNEESSCFVRVSQPWAGSGFGAVFLPRIGQEVIVGFLEGDPDQPMVIGRVYNQDNMVPWELPAHQTVSGIKTRSSPHGAPANYNELTFEDKKGKEKVNLQAEKDQHTYVKDTKTTQVDKKYELTTGKVMKVVLTAKDDGTLEITAGKSIELKCGTSSIKLEMAQIEIKSTMVNITSTGPLSLTGLPTKINS